MRKNIVRKAKKHIKNAVALLLTVVMAILLSITVRASGYGYSTIDSTTFKSNYKITSIHIGSDVIDITNNAFWNLNNLKSITVSENNPFYASYSGCLYDKYYTELLCYPPALGGTYIPETVVSIGKNALHGVPEKLKTQIRDVVDNQAQGNWLEDDIPGEHFVHIEGTVKWKMEDGSIVSPTSNVMNLAAQIVEKSTTGDMTQAQQLEAAFSYLSTYVSYERSLDEPSGDWTKEYTSKTLATRRGNCYGYAASFAYIAKGLGYDARVCTGTVTSALGGRTDHAWTEVKMKNKWYIFDAEMQNAKGSGYYKQTSASYPAGPIETLERYAVEF